MGLFTNIMLVIQAITEVPGFQLKTHSLLLYSFENHPFPSFVSSLTTYNLTTKWLSNVNSPAGPGGPHLGVFRLFGQTGPHRFGGPIFGTLLSWFDDITNKWKVKRKK